MQDSPSPRDHGGNLDAALHRHGGARADWVDLSTGINPTPYPLPALPPSSWASLPTRSDLGRLGDAAKRAYDTSAAVVPFGGAQGAIQAIPWLRPPGHARVLGPTYNEHDATLRFAGWQVETVTDIAALGGCDLAVVVTPNNPDGQTHQAQDLLDLSTQVGLLVVDESFADPDPAQSLAPRLGAGPGGTSSAVIVLRSFGKFYGLAGVRLGFALARGPIVERLRGLAGPWPVSGPAIEIGIAALQDTGWQAATRARLHQDAARLDSLASEAGWRLVGGTPLFRTYATPQAETVQTKLAEHRIWSRSFPYSHTWLRLGLPPQDRWPQIERAMTALAC